MLASFIFGLLSVVTLGVAELSHPAVKPPVKRAQVGKALNTNLTVPTYQATELPKDLIAHDCKYLANQYGFNATDVRTYNVTYEDCDTPWYLCIHKQVPTPATTMIKEFGKLPVTARSATKHLILLPGGSCGGVTTPLNGNTVLFGQCGTGIAVYIHENCHSNDYHGFPSSPSYPFSNSKPWLMAYHADTAVVTAYARTDQAENLAETSWNAMYDANIKGGLIQVEPNVKAIQNQLSTIQQYGGNQFHPGGTCPYRLPNSAIVKNDGSSASVSRRAASIVDVSIPEYIEVRAVPPIEENTVFVETAYDF